jgi:hypothetical protein
VADAAGKDVQACALDAVGEVRRVPLGGCGLVAVPHHDPHWDRNGRQTGRSKRVAERRSDSKDRADPLVAIRIAGPLERGANLRIGTRLGLHLLV